MVFLYPYQVFSCSATEYCVSKNRKLRNYRLESKAHFEILDPHKEEFELKNIRACFDVSENTEAVVDFRIEITSVDKGLAVLCIGTAMIPKDKRAKK